MIHTSRERPRETRISASPLRWEDLPLLARVAMVLRGLWAVLWLLVTAVAALLSAVLGVRPGLARSVGHVIADEYRAGRHGHVYADVVDDPNSEVEP
jgi:hypothetical protein